MISIKADYWMINKMFHLECEQKAIKFRKQMKNFLNGNSTQVLQSIILSTGKQYS